MSVNFINRNNLYNFIFYILFLLFIDINNIFIYFNWIIFIDQNNSIINSLLFSYIALSLKLLSIIHCSNINLICWLNICLLLIWIIILTYVSIFFPYRNIYVLFILFGFLQSIFTMVLLSISTEKGGYKQISKSIVVHECKNESCVFCPCSICLENNKSSVHLKCNHMFHENCLKRWLKISKVKLCPNCRAVI